MQTLHIEELNFRRFPRDVLAYNRYEHTDNPHFRQVTHEKRVDILISSIHANKPRTIQASAADVEVISYCPDLIDREWPEFYTRLCLAKIIACDSFVKAQIDKLAYPHKPWINLDGVKIDVNPNTLIMEADTDKAIKIGYIGGKNSLWDNYKNWLERRDSKDTAIFQGVDDITMAHVIISFKPIGSLLANAVSQQAAYFWTAYDPLACLYLDCRFTHNYEKRFAHATNMQGAASSKVMGDAFEVFTEELTQLFIHSSVIPVTTFTSNVTIVDRIVNEINRAL